MKLYLQKLAVDWIWPVGSNLHIPILGKWEGNMGDLIVFVLCYSLVFIALTVVKIKIYIPIQQINIIFLCSDHSVHLHVEFSYSLE